MREWINLVVEKLNDVYESLITYIDNHNDFYIVLGIIIFFFFMTISTYRHKFVRVKFIKYCLFFATLGICIVVLFRKTSFPNTEESEYFINFLDRFDIIASALLAIVALRMSVAQKNMQELEFCEKIGFHEFESEFETEIVETNEARYLDIIKKFANPCEELRDIYGLKLVLKNQLLNPRINYKLDNVKLYDATYKPVDVKSINKLFKYQSSNNNVECYKHVGFDYNINICENNTKNVDIKIYIEDMGETFLKYLFDPKTFVHTNCENMSLVLNFIIEDIGNSSIYNNKLVVIISLSKTTLKGVNKYIIKETRSFAF